MRAEAPVNAPSISDIVERIRSYAPDADIQPVMTAYLLAARVHAGGLEYVAARLPE